MIASGLPRNQAQIRNQCVSEMVMQVRWFVFGRFGADFSEFQVRHVGSSHAHSSDSELENIPSRVQIGVRLRETLEEEI